MYKSISAVTCNTAGRPIYRSEQLVKAGLLAPPPSQQPSHKASTLQWQSEAERVSVEFTDRGYSGGTAPGFHGIPY